MSVEATRPLQRSWSWLIPSGIRWKIAAPFVVLTLVVAVAGTYLATELVSKPLEDRFVNQMAEAARVTADSVVRRERQHLQVLRAITYTAGIPEALRSNDEQALSRLIQPIAANSKTEYVEVLDFKGRRVLGMALNDEQSLTYRPLTDPPDRSSLAIVQSILKGQFDDSGSKFAQIVQLQDGAALYTAGPIYDGKNVIGVVMVGSSLDSFLASVKREALADVTFYDMNGQVLSSTFDDSEDATLTPGGANVSPDTLAGIRESKSLFGRGYEFLYGELRLRDETVGAYSVALPSTFISSANSHTRSTMIAVFAAATMAVLAIGTLVAKSVTAPLIRLARTALAVSAGDLTIRSGYRGRDEVGILATSFDIMTSRLATQHLQTIKALTSAIDARDPYTAGHSIRVGQLSVEIGRELELPRRELQFLEIGGYLHDVGKIGIRDNVLLKNGPLTPQERALVEEHPRIGLSIIQHVELPQEIIEVVGGHHEKLDGTGYPYGLVGDAVTIFARIASVSDVFDALTTHRPYRPALELRRAAEILRTEVTLGHLDARVVDALFKTLPRWSRRLDTEKELRGLLLPELEELAKAAGFP